MDRLAASQRKIRIWAVSRLVLCEFLQRAKADLFRLPALIQDSPVEPPDASNCLKKKIVLLTLILQPRAEASVLLLAGGISLRK